MHVMFPFLVTYDKMNDSCHCLITVAGIDYNPNSVDAVFLAGERSATIGIPILLDNEAEEDEQFGLAIAIPSELSTVLSLGTPSNATGIIEDSSGK